MGLGDIVFSKFENLVASIIKNLTLFGQVKLAHLQIVINCQYSVAQLCTHEDTLAHTLGEAYFDDVISHNSLTTLTLIIHCEENYLFYV